MLNLISQFKLALAANPEAIHYLLDRNIRKEAIKEFQIGFCPVEYKKEYKGSDIAWLAGRIVFPMFDAYGNLIAYAGRGIHGEKPKYINTEYSKVNNFYNLEKAKEEILRLDYAILVEGQIDVITAYINGLKNVVGLCGIVFGEERVALLGRYTNNIILISDNDKAGINCSKKIEKILKSYNFDVKIVDTAPCKDIDEILNSNYKLDFIEKLNNKINNYEIFELEERLDRVK